MCFLTQIRYKSPALSWISTWNLDTALAGRGGEGRTLSAGPRCPLGGERWQRDSRDGFCIPQVSISLSDIPRVENTDFGAEKAILQQGWEQTLGETFHWSSPEPQANILPKSSIFIFFFWLIWKISLVPKLCFFKFFSPLFQLQRFRDLY